MRPVTQTFPLLSTLSDLPLKDNARALGLLILGAPGAGKTILESLLLLFDLLRGRPGCVLDPLGTLSEAFLFRLLFFFRNSRQGKTSSCGNACGTSHLAEAISHHFLSTGKGRVCGKRESG
jgi:hypothetical protein